MGKFLYSSYEDRAGDSGMKYLKILIRLINRSFILAVYGT